MTNILKKIISYYFRSRWFPAVVFLAVLVFCNLFLFYGDMTQALWHIFIQLHVLDWGPKCACAGAMLAVIWNFTKKRWAAGLINLGILVVFGTVANIALGYLVLAAFIGPDEDNFADNLKIPDNMVIAVPASMPDSKPGNKDDVFQARLRGALARPGSTDATISANITSLVRLQKERPDILRRFLAVSPAWRVFQERGAAYATRRWMIGSTWRYELHGYYSKSDFGQDWIRIPDFQSRLTIGFSGKPWARSDNTTTHIKIGETVGAVLSQGNQMNESHCVITVDDLVVEVFEQSQAKERRLTKAALAYLDEELRPLLTSPSWGNIKAIVPAGSIKNGEPSLELRNLSQPGLYESVIWVNPGEPGMIYLKAFEVTKGIALSERRLKNYSNEWIGWSDNPTEQFFSNTCFTVYEGDWGKPYAARFEVWFVPGSGKPERKLMEKVFKIEGWQR